MSPNRNNRNYNGLAEQGQAAPVKKKIVKPVTAGKAFALGLLASFILMLLFSAGLIFFAMTRSAAETGQYAQLLSDARNEVMEASVDVAFSPAPSIREKALSPSVSLEVTKLDKNKNVDTVVNGSGVVLGKDGDIVTNYHVIQNAKEILATVNGITYVATVSGVDETSDLAMIKIDAKDLVVAQRGVSADTMAGDFVMAVGNPYGLNDSITTGVISHKGRNMTLPNEQITVTYADMIQTDVQANSGNSGGGLYNAHGELIGLTTLILSDDSDSDSIVYAIPVDFFYPIASQLMVGKPASHASLGISISDVPEDAVNKYGLNDNHGAYVTNITPSGPAEASGLIANDIISEYNGVEVENAQDLLYKIRATKINDQIQVKVLREGREMNFQIKVGADV